MPVVNFESYFADSDNHDQNYFHVAANDANNRLQRTYWNVQPGKTLTIDFNAPAPHGVHEVLEATALTGEIDGENPITGNQFLVEVTDPDGTYFESPWTWGVVFSDNGLG